jgi:hypothetical protein
MHSHADELLQQGLESVLDEHVRACFLFVLKHKMLTLQQR